LIFGGQKFGGDTKKIVKITEKVAIDSFGCASPTTIKSLGGAAT
jgi:hypothetical protein